MTLIFTISATLFVKKFQTIHQNFDEQNIDHCAILGDDSRVRFITELRAGANPEGLEREAGRGLLQVLEEEDVRVHRAEREQRVELRVEPASDLNPGLESFFPKCSTLTFRPRTFFPRTVVEDGD